MTHTPILINKEDIMVSEAFKNRTRDEIIAAFYNPQNEMFLKN